MTYSQVMGNSSLRILLLIKPVNTPREHWAGEFALPSRCLQRAQEVQDVLHLRRAERFEVPDHSICFRATVLLALPATLRFLTAVGRTVVCDGLEQVGSPAVMQEKQPLANAPERSGAELIRARRALIDTVRQS